MLQRIKEEPVAFQALLQALIAMAVTFGLQLEAAEVAAILAVTAAVLGFFTRQAVTPIVKMMPAAAVTAPQA
jgi:hypothetical protein